MNLGVDDGGVYADFGLRVEFADASYLPTRRVVAAPTYVLDSGQSERRDSAALEEYPEIIGWYTADGTRFATGDTVPAERLIGEGFTVRIRQPAMSATTVRFAVEVMGS